MKGQRRTIGLWKGTAFLAFWVRQHHIQHVGLSEVSSDGLPKDDTFPSPGSTEQVSDDGDFLFTVVSIPVRVYTTVGLYQQSLWSSPFT